ncbi:50S ribosomal protein L9 [Adlercreutzia sp. ZJ154]|uniref:50S ribosomal protein L9 n=1 Tax=Adlercreutzia sp. ZJ154 TaxID=2709790 RepID=UPI0013EE3148|nr:50S ribosomal protein L9 [Adlercreutzia sp. ZJ154]
MQVILLKEVRGRGGEGDVIEVARGFANNYLLRQGYAVKATPGNLKQLEQRRKNIEKREEVRVADAEALVKKLDGATVKVKVQVGDEGQLFGSVTAPMIADAIKESLGIEVDRRRIELGKPIKTTGVFPVSVNVYRTIKATVNVSVAADTEVDTEPEPTASDAAAETDAAVEAPTEEAETAEATATEEAPVEETAE